MRTCLNARSLPPTWSSVYNHVNSCMLSNMSNNIGKLPIGYVIKICRWMQFAHLWMHALWYHNDDTIGIYKIFDIVINSYLLVKPSGHMSQTGPKRYFIPQNWNFDSTDHSLCSVLETPSKLYIFGKLISYRCHIC